MLGVVLSAGTAAGFGSTHVSVGLRIGVPPPVIVHQAPPRHVTEVVVVSPGPGYVWVAGHYSWANNQWVWIPGAWMTPPEAGAVWVEGRWDQAAQTWTEGHWEIAQAAAPTTPPPPVAAAPAPVAPAATTVVITSAPPPLRHEWRGHRPGRDFIWVSGYWRWDGGRHVWVAGHWMRPPQGHRVWVAPRWEHRGGTYVFIEGTWR